MLSFAVIDPRALDEAGLRASSDRLRGSEQLFRNAAETSGNVVFIGDGDNRLRAKVIEAIELLPPDVGQHLRTYLEDLLKSFRVRFVERAPPAPTGLAVPKLVGYSASCKWCDALWESDLTKAAREIPELAPLMRDLVDYEHSDFEATRRLRAGPQKHLSIMSKTEFEDLIGRSVAYSRWLRFYDRSIGPSSKGLKPDSVRPFVRGITHVVRIWRAAYPLNPTPEVAVYTLSPTEYSAFPLKEKEILDGFALVATELDKALTPLGVKASLHFKYNKELFHPRYLETELCAIYFDAGFKIVGKNGALLNNKFRLDDDQYYLSQVRALPGFDALASGPAPLSAAPRTPAT